VQLIGNDGFNTPPAHALGEQGIVKNVTGYTVYGDYREGAPAAQIIKAVERGDIDVAAVWGPLAGYFAKLSSVPLDVSPLTHTEEFAPLLFEYAIAVGVRKSDGLLKAQIDAIIDRKQVEIDSLLAAYNVPVIHEHGVR
jgi:ABC-type amino acid transport substrate-binding protein